MLYTANIPEGFWPETVRVSTYLKNHSPHKAIGMTPYEAWFSKKPNLSHIRIFGCRYYGHVEKKIRTKWESHTTEGILMGYFAHSVIKLIQFAAFPTKSYMAIAKHVLRYLKVTMNVMLTFGSSDAVKEVDSKYYHQLTAYFDSL